MPSYTTNYNLAKPNINDPTDQDLWGDYLNSDLDSLDTDVFAAGRMPVGSIYINKTDATNPATLLGYGTWTAIAGLGLVGVGTGTDSNGATHTFTAGTQVGEYVHTLTSTEMPSHTHTDLGHTHGPADLWRNHGGSVLLGAGSSSYGTTDVGYANIQNTGGGGSHNNIMPVIGVYMWYRSA